eukprot:1180925-Prorocentrum_minimum.AAC.2
MRNQDHMRTEQGATRRALYCARQSHYRGGNMPGGGANHITGEGICLEGEPITSQGAPGDGGMGGWGEKRVADGAVWVNLVRVDEFDGGRGGRVGGSSDGVHETLTAAVQVRIRARAPITLQGREYARRGIQSHHMGGNMHGGGANHIT